MSSRRRACSATPRSGRASRGVQLELPNGERVTYTVTVSDLYSTRAATLEQIRSALIGAGLLALGASLVTGIVAARSLTVPIARLRRVSARVAQGQLDERAAPSGVLEIDELGQQFNVMADRLSGTLRMLEADRDRLREFVADVSHELRTPIAALRMYTELQRDGEIDEATRREFLDRSLDQIQRLDWLSTNLLDLSRIDAGIYPLDMRTGDLRDPVQAVVQALSEAAVERGVALESTVPAEPVELRFDRERIVQLMTNLIGNAIKFTPRGGAVSVRLEERPSDVLIEVTRYRRRHPGRRAAAHLRALLPRHEHRRGARIGQRPGARDRALDRGDARRPDRARQRGRQGHAGEDHPAAAGRRHGREPRGADREGQRNFTRRTGCSQSGHRRLTVARPAYGNP